MVDLIDAIVVDLSDQKLCAYNRQQQLVRMVLVSTGKASSPTPTGVGQVYSKYPSITMRDRGSVAPGVPWALGPGRQRKQRHLPAWSPLAGGCS